MVYNLTCSRTPPAAVQIKTQARTFTLWSRARPGHHIGDHLQVLRWRFHSCFASAFFALSAAVYYWINQSLAKASCICAIAQLRSNLSCAIIPIAWERLQVLRWRFQLCFTSANFASRAAVHCCINLNVAQASYVCAVVLLLSNSPCLPCAARAHPPKQIQAVAA